MSTITDINQLDLNKIYSYADYLQWNFRERVELIKGRIFKMSPAPGRQHQEVSMTLSSLLFYHLKHRKCKVFAAPFDVRLNVENKIDTVVQPDISVICDPTKLDERGCQGAPDMIVEILSLSTSHKDLNEKKLLYQQNGVKEYWVVHPSEGTVLQYFLNKTTYELMGVFSKGDMVEVLALPGLSVDLNEVFTE